MPMHNHGLALFVLVVPVAVAGCELAVWRVVP
jgi:hypothetical protein